MERPDLAGILSFEPRPSASSQSSSGLHDLTEAPLSANVTEVIDKKNLTIFGVWPLKKMERRPHLGPLFLTFFLFQFIWTMDGFLERLGNWKKIWIYFQENDWNNYDIVGYIQCDNKRVCIDQDVIDCLPIPLWPKKLTRISYNM